jgi:hypothetical protein
MGKRSAYPRHARDFYKTPIEAVAPLLPHLSARTFAEPCCGDGALVRHLQSHGLQCSLASDIKPRGYGQQQDALSIAFVPQQFMTNPPWSREILHGLIEHLSDLAPTWLLFDADWMHTKQAVPHLKRCSKIVSVGRVKWIAGTAMTGKDNVAWYLFDRTALSTIFIPQRLSERPKPSLATRQPTPSTHLPKDLLTPFP